MSYEIQGPMNGNRPNSGWFRDWCRAEFTDGVRDRWACLRSHPEWSRCQIALSLQFIYYYPTQHKCFRFVMHGALTKGNLKWDKGIAKWDLQHFCLILFLTAEWNQQWRSKSKQISSTAHPVSSWTSFSTTNPSSSWTDLSYPLILRRTVSLGHSIISNSSSLSY